MAEPRRTIEQNTDIIATGMQDFAARLAALEAKLQPRPLPSRVPDAAVIEVVERRRTTVGDIGVIVPNEVRINGIPLLCSADKPVIVHELGTSDSEAVLVTLTVFARRVVIGEEIDPD